MLARLTSFITWQAHCRQLTLMAERAIGCHAGLGRLGVSCSASLDSAADNTDSMLTGPEEGPQTAVATSASCLREASELLRLTCSRRPISLINWRAHCRQLALVAERADEYRAGLRRPCFLAQQAWTQLPTAQCTGSMLTGPEEGPQADCACRGHKHQLPALH